jgi:hypothetical protein
LFSSFDTFNDLKNNFRFIGDFHDVFLFVDNKKTTPTSSLSESKPKRTPPGLKDKKQPAIKGERFTLQLQQ